VRRLAPNAKLVVERVYPTHEYESLQRGDALRLSARIDALCLHDDADRILPESVHVATATLAIPEASGAQPRLLVTR
jgi:hypothetical protein